MFNRSYFPKRKRPAPRSTPRVSSVDVVSDAVLLDIYDRVLRQKQTMAMAGEAHGLTRSAVAGHLKRLKGQPDDETAVKRPENRNGFMGPRWWEAGLTAQRRSGRVTA